MVPITIANLPEFGLRSAEITTRFKSFFVTGCQIDVVNLGIIRATCPRLLCDGQMSTKACPCTAVLPKNAWTLRMTINCDHLGSSVEIDVCGHNLTSWFAKPAVRVSKYRVSIKLCLPIVSLDFTRHRYHIGRCWFDRTIWDMGSSSTACGVYQWS